jgi:predicted NBD/HSP70 family sugar kinase
MTTDFTPPASGMDRRFRPVRRATVTDRERLILHLIRREGQITRSEVIRATGLPGAAVFRVTEDLAARGLVDLGEGVAHGVGKPSTMLRLRAHALATIGLSVMTDFAEVVLLDFAGEVRAAREVTVPGMDRDRILERVAAFVAEEGAKGFEPGAIFGIGVAFAGYFVGDGTKMNPAAPLDSWALTDLEPLVAQRMGLETTIENIASAAAVGERLLGVGRRIDSFAYINVAHGLGAGLVLNGELYRGRHGNAGEVAGLLDQFAGLPVPNLESLRLALQSEGIDLADVRELVTHYRDDWSGIAEWVAWAAPSFSILGSLFRQTLDCDAIVLGGRLPEALAARILEAITWPEQSQAQRRGIGLPPARFVAAEVTARSAAIGGAAIPLRAGYFL